MAEGLTARQSECLEVIAAYIADHGISPTYREIKDDMRLASTSNINRLVLSLERRGFVTFEHGLARSIRIVNAGEHGPDCPVCDGNWKSLDKATRDAMLGIAKRYRAGKSEDKDAA